MSDPRKRFDTDAERQTERRVRNVLKGLTTQGKPRQRRPNFPNRELAREHRLKRNLARYRRLARENKAKGLRVDGKPFRRHVQFHAWKNFRAALPTAPVGNWEMIER